MGVVTCSICGKEVSNKVSEKLVVRAFVECPECVEEERYKEVLEEMGIGPGSDNEGG